MDAAVPGHWLFDVWRVRVGGYVKRLMLIPARRTVTLDDRKSVEGSGA